MKLPAILFAAAMVLALTGCATNGGWPCMAWDKNTDQKNDEAAKKYLKSASIYHDCDGRVDTNWVSELAKCSGTNFIGVYRDMAAVWHPEDAARYAGVAMFSTCPGYQGEYLKDISSKDFEAIFINKTKPEYSK